MQDNMNTERFFLERLSEGDELAFRYIFDRYHAFIYSFARRMTDSDMIAKDIVQDVMIRLWMNRENLAEVTNLGAYINRITRNLVLNGMKRKAYETAFLDELQQNAGYNNSTEETAFRREMEKLLHEAVEQLPPQQRQAYILSRHTGLSHEEISKRMFISRETVKKHVMAALRSIRVYLEKNGNAMGLLLLIIADICL